MGDRYQRATADVLARQGGGAARHFIFKLRRIPAEAEAEIHDSAEAPEGSEHQTLLAARGDDYRGGFRRGLNQNRSPQVAASWAVSCRFC